MCEYDIAQHAVNEKRDIIVVGTAMGGLSAVCKLVGGLPSNFEATLLVAFDSCSQPADSVLQILRHYSRADVNYAHDGMLIRPGRVILTPQGQCMRLSKPGVIQIEPRSGNQVDLLFETAARVYGSRVIGVVLTGGSHDGTTGLSAIEAAGGVGVVQDPDEALDGAMPLSAIYGDDPDYCVGLAEMPALLVQLAAGKTPATE